MITIDAFLLFFMTTFFVILSPGPAVITVMSESINNHFRQTLWLILGIAIANVIFFILSATGIAALLLASNFIFSLIKWLGVAYLLYLGLRLLMNQSKLCYDTIGLLPKKAPYKLFAKGFMLEIVNPKALLYFSALLPQFIDLSVPLIPQLIIFCTITFILDMSCYSLYALFAATTMKNKKDSLMVNLINKIAGGILIFIGIRMAAFEQ